MCFSTPEYSSLASLQTESYGELMLTIDKWHLDDAHKDKQNKIFDQNFKVTFFTSGRKLCIQPQILCHSGSPVHASCT